MAGSMIWFKCQTCSILMHKLGFQPNYRIVGLFLALSISVNAFIFRRGGMQLATVFKRHEGHVAYPGKIRSRRCLRTASVAGPRAR